MPWGSLPFQNCIHPRKVVPQLFQQCILVCSNAWFPFTRWNLECFIDTGIVDFSNLESFVSSWESGCSTTSYHFCDKVQYGFCEWAWVARGDKVRCLAGNYHVLRAKYTSPAGGTRLLTFLEQDIPHATISSPESLFYRPPRFYECSLPCSKGIILLHYMPELGLKRNRNTRKLVEKFAV